MAQTPLGGSGATAVGQPPSTSSPRETPEEAKRRFEIECEFVQSLANPNYVCFLSQRGYFKEEYFVNYLRYLLYFKRQEYVKTLKYPYCLQILELLQNPEFRLDMSVASSAHYVEDQMCLVWCQELRERMRTEAQMENENAEEGDGEGGKNEANPQAKKEPTTSNANG